MRQAAAVAVAASLVVLAGCSDGDGRDAEVERLEQLGFFAYADGAARESVVEEVRADPETGVFADRARRFWFADAEDLAEGGAGAWLTDLAPLLRELGVPRLRIRDDFREDAYDVIVNGRRHPILTVEETASDRLWGHAAARSVAILNELLRKAGSDERAYGYASAESNDFSDFVLTPALRDVVAEILGEGGPDAPYEVRNEPPSFGYAHWEDAFVVRP